MSTDSFAFLALRFGSVAAISCQGFLACTLEADPVNPDVTGTRTSALADSRDLRLDSVSSRPVRGRSGPRWTHPTNTGPQYQTLASTGTTGRELALSFSCELGASSPGPANGACLLPYDDGCMMVGGPDGAEGDPPDWLQWESGGEANGHVVCVPGHSSYLRLGSAAGPLVHLPAVFASRGEGSVRAYVEYSIGSPAVPLRFCIGSPLGAGSCFLAPGPPIPTGPTTLAIQQHMEDGSWQDLAQRQLDTTGAAGYFPSSLSTVLPNFVPTSWRWEELSVAVKGGTEVRVEIRGEGGSGWRAFRTIRLFGQECIPDASNRENCL